MTLLYFPVCVVLAWIADRRLLFYKYMNKRYRADKRHGIVVQMEGDAEPNGIDVVMDGKFPDDGAGAGNCSSVSGSVQAAGEEDANREEVGNAGGERGREWGGGGSVFQTVSWNNPIFIRGLFPLANRVQTVFQSVFDLCCS